jgi:hypothetical protein
VLYPYSARRFSASAVVSPLPSSACVLVCNVHQIDRNSQSNLK